MQTNLSMFIEPWVLHLFELDATLTMAYTQQHQSPVDLIYLSIVSLSLFIVFFFPSFPPFPPYFFFFSLSILSLFWLF